MKLILLVLPFVGVEDYYTDHRGVRRRVRYVAYITSFKPLRLTRFCGW